MKRPNLYDRLKVIAILTMIVDHLGYVFFPVTLDWSPENLWLRLVGRIAFPIFLFLVGFNGNYKRRRDLFWFAIAIQIPIVVASVWFHFGWLTLNILRGILIGRVVLGLVNWVNWATKPSLLSFTKFIIFTIGLFLIHPWLMQVVDYGSFVILFPLGGVLMRLGGQKRFLSLLYLIICFTWLRFFSWYVFWFDVLQLFILGGFFILLLCIFFVLWQGNRYLPIGKKIDACILFVSKNALLVYVFHLLILRWVKIILLWR